MENRGDDKILRGSLVVVCILLAISIFFILYFFRETNILKNKNSELVSKDKRTNIEMHHLKKNFENLEAMVNQAEKILVEGKYGEGIPDGENIDFQTMIIEKEKLLKQKEEQFLLSVKKINKILSELSREKGNSGLFEKNYDKALFHYFKSIEYSDNIATRIALMELIRILENKNNKFVEHEEKVTCLSITEDGKTLASGGMDGIINIWNIPDMKIMKKINTEGYGINALKFIDNRNLAYAGDNKLIKVVDIEKEFIVKTFKGHNGSITAIDYCPSKKIIASSSFDKSIKIWDFENQSLINNITGHGERDNSVKFSNNGKLLVGGGKENIVFLYDTNNFQVINKFKIFNAGINTLNFDKNDKYIISGTGSYFGDNEFLLKLVDIKTGNVINIYDEHSDYVTSADSLSFGEQFFISGSNDFTIKLWGMETSDSLFTFRGHTDYVNQAIVTKDGRYIISCSTDKSVRIWATGINEDISKIKKNLKLYEIK